MPVAALDVVDADGELHVVGRGGLEHLRVDHEARPGGRHVEAVLIAHLDGGHAVAGGAQPQLARARVQDPLLHQRRLIRLDDEAAHRLEGTIHI